MKNFNLFSFLFILSLTVITGLTMAIRLNSPWDNPVLQVNGADHPILIITNTSYPFSQYYAEILHNEGFNEFDNLDLSQVSGPVLSNYDLIVLGEMPLTSGQAVMLEDWVNAGGNLIAMRPDRQLADLLGLTTVSTTLKDAYLQINDSGPGVGIVNQTIQFHGTADLYSLSGATSLATLFSDGSTSTNSPAITINSVGANNGKAAAFTYDLARSVIYTRQGNPEWAGQVRNPWVNYYVPLDLFYPDWIDFNKITIPQADEQQRFLANLITTMNLSKKPLPRFWYLPRGEKAVVILTGDDHTGYLNLTYSGNTVTFFENQIAKSAVGCSVDDWECIRSTSYMYIENPMTDAQAANYTRQGFEIGLHVNAAKNTSSWCNSWNATSLSNEYQSQLDNFYAKYSSLMMQASERSHCYSWYLYSEQANVQAYHGIRLDTNIPYWPYQWFQRRPGFMIGSAMPMRFVDSSGNLIDVYLSSTIISDDTTRRIRDIDVFINSLIDWARGPEGYYGVFTVLAHSDNYYGDSYRMADQIIGAAINRGVPVVSGRQMVEWLDARNASSFNSITFDGSNLSFQIRLAPGAHGIQAMLPANSTGGHISQIFRDGIPIAFKQEVLKGIEYAGFDGLAGAYTANYSSTGTTATPTSQGTATQTSVATSTPTRTATTLPLPTATPTNSPTPTRTNTPAPTSGPTATPTATATFPADLIFADSFETGNLSSWSSNSIDGGDLSASPSAAIVGSYGLIAVIDDNSPIFVTDNSPNAVTHYRASFFFDPNSISMPESSFFPVFVGYSSNSTMILRIEIRYSNGNFTLRTRVRLDGTSWANTSYLNLNDAPNHIEVEFWSASSPSASDGHLILRVNDSQVTTLDNIDNDTRNLDRVSLGLPAGVVSGTNGAIFLDEFNSWR